MSKTTMSIQEVANRLVELCRKGQILEAQEELYGNEITSIEPTHSQVPPVIGKEAVLAKGKHFASTIIERHGGSFGDPIIGGNYFSISCSLDATFKERGRNQINEICVFQVKDGKVISEQFFY
ncbi:MAG: SnoaL-like domain-containing protein [Cyclobacteriaceae bacterium]